MQSLRFSWLQIDFFFLPPISKLKLKAELIGFKFKQSFHPPQTNYDNQDFPESLQSKRVWSTLLSQCTTESHSINHQAPLSEIQSPQAKAVYLAVYCSSSFPNTGKRLKLPESESNGSFVLLVLSCLILRFQNQKVINLSFHYSHHYSHIIHVQSPSLANASRWSLLSFWPKLTANVNWLNPSN